MKPTFIGIGAQKCASSWIYKILEDHPEVAVSNPKEIDFFSCHYINGFAWYEQFFPNNTGAKALGEISPSYWHDLHTPARIRQYLPEVKIILALRDPISRAYSNFIHDLRLQNNVIKTMTFEAGLKNNPMYIEQSLYAKQLERWLDVFPKDQLLCLFQEEIQENPAREAARLYHFLEIDDSFVSQFLYKKSNASYIPRLGWLDESIISLSRLAKNSGMGWAIRSAKEFGLSGFVHGFNRKKAAVSIPPMGAETRQWLEKLFAPDIKKLGQLLGRNDLPWPNARNASSAQWG